MEPSGNPKKLNTAQKMSFDIDTIRIERTPKRTKRGLNFELQDKCIDGPKRRQTFPGHGYRRRNRGKKTHPDCHSDRACRVKIQKEKMKMKIRNELKDERQHGPDSGLR